MTKSFAFLLISNFSQKPLLGPSNVFICSPLPRAGSSAGTRRVCACAMGRASRAETPAKLQSLHLAS